MRITRTDRRRDGGLRVRFAVGECSLGSLLLAATAEGVCALLVGDDSAALVEDLRTRFPAAQIVEDDAALSTWVSQAALFIDSPHRGLTLPLDLRGTDFQLRVWEALRATQPGDRLTYAELAQRLGAPGSARAVAGACASNQLAVAVPCHRVVRGDGELAGYRWGVERKRALLELEQRV